MLVPDTEILYMIQILMHGNFFHLTFLEDTPTSCNQIYCILRYKIKHKTDSLRVCSSLQCYRSFIILFISKLHRNFDSTLLEIILFQKHNPGYDISHLITTKIVQFFAMSNGSIFYHKSGTKMQIHIWKDVPSLLEYWKWFWFILVTFNQHYFWLHRIVTKGNYYKHQWANTNPNIYFILSSLWSRNIWACFKNQLLFAS